MHFYEAVLATLAIVVWHFYSVIFDPDVYPLNTASLTGFSTRLRDIGDPTAVRDAPRNSLPNHDKLSGSPLRGWLSPLVHLSNNWISLMGVVIVTRPQYSGCSCCPRRCGATSANPYFGILAVPDVADGFLRRSGPDSAGHLAAAAPRAGNRQDYPRVSRR